MIVVCDFWWDRLYTFYICIPSFLVDLQRPSHPVRIKKGLKTVNICHYSVLFCHFLLVG